MQQSGSKRVLALLALLKRPHKIESDAVMRQKLDYIHRNPVKRGYVDVPEIGVTPVRGIMQG